MNNQSRTARIVPAQMCILQALFKLHHNQRPGMEPGFEKGHPLIVKGTKKSQQTCA